MPLDIAALAGGFAEGAGERLIEYGIGVAIAEALRPEAVREGQEAWKIDPTKAVEPGTAAAIVAEDVRLRDWGAEEAAQGGINDARFDAIVGEVLNAPGTGELYRAYRRGNITEEQFVHGLRKAKLETLWDAAMLALKDERLGPDVIARAIQRGLVADPGLLPVGPPTVEGKVAAFPVFSVDALAEAAAWGIDRERLGVEVGLVGNPASPQQAAAALFRGIIEHPDYQRAIAEGNTRNEWGDAILEVSRQIPTDAQFVENRLRGWSDDAAMYAGTALHGMSREHTDVLFKNMGRPLSFHQVFIGLRRGGVYDGPTDRIDPAFLKALQESSVRPEWYNLAWAQRFTYPAAFVLRALTEAHDITGDEAEQILLYEGWEPGLAKTVAAKWSAGTAGKGDAHVAKAETQLWGTLHKAYVDDEADDTLARTTLTAIGVAPDAQPQVLTLWQAERALVRATLTPVQIRKAVGQPGKDDAWALERLRELGYTDDDARTFLDE